MRKFAESYPEREIVQQAAAQIPWFHNCMILDKVQDTVQRDWYTRATIEHGWSRAVLVHQIESDLYGRQGTALTNFQATLPPPQSDLAQQCIKDPYNFEFLGLGQDISERQLEKALIERLKDFLIELGKGFAFVGQQYHLDVGGEDYYIDLLFYHLHLRCYVVIDLKVVPFKPEFAGKMNFYLSAVDDRMRHPADQPAIGLILCKERNRLVVEYALRDTTKPMGVVTYRILPRRLKGELPTATEIKRGLGRA
jgi:predicted nuclease of restriction endonuclease-like (RecB) superfamily